MRERERERSIRLASCLRYLDELVIGAEDECDPLARGERAHRASLAMMNAPLGLRRPLGVPYQPDVAVRLGDEVKYPLELEVPIMLGSAPWQYTSAHAREVLIRLSGRTRLPVQLWAPILPRETALIEECGATVIALWDAGRFGVTPEYLQGAVAVECSLLDHYAPTAAYFPPEVARALHLAPRHPIHCPAAPMDCVSCDDLARTITLLGEVTAHQLPILLTLPGASFERLLAPLASGAVAPDGVIIDCEGPNWLPGAEWTARSAVAVLDVLQIRSLEPDGAALATMPFFIIAPIGTGAGLLKLLAMGAAGVTLRESLVHMIAAGEAEGLGVEDVVERCVTMLRSMVGELVHIMAHHGWEELGALSRAILRAASYDAAAVTGLPLVGYGRPLPMWQH